VRPAGQGAAASERQQQELGAEYGVPAGRSRDPGPDDGVARPA
jgi:hypothetical protein